jgi:hypothetical protein
MTFLLGVSLLIAVTVGTILALALLPAKGRGLMGLMFSVWAGAGLGIGVTSCLYFLVLLLGQRRYFVLIELLIAGFIVLLWPVLIRKKILYAAPSETSVPGRGGTLQKILYAVFGGIAASSLVALVLAFLKDPHGKWDAWLIWNTHARFIFRSGEAWQGLFTSGLDWTHLDYPLMLPLSVVRAWQYAGGESLFAPMAIAFVFICATIGLLHAALSILRSTGQGLLAGIALMGSPFFIILGAYQVADIPLAFFILLALVVFAFHDRSPEKGGRTLVLAGLATGLAAWTKNEGLLFLAAVPVVRFAVAARCRGWGQAGKELLWFAAGAVPVLFILVIFKSTLAPPNDIFSGQTVSEIANRLADPERYVQILKAYLLTGLTFTQGVMNIQTGIRFNPGAVSILLMAVYLICMGVKVSFYDRPAVKTASLILLAMAAGFFLVYLLTPHNLYWHLTTSLNRLLTQLWPGFLFLIFMAARIPEEADVGRLSATTGLAQTGTVGQTKRKKTKTKRA